MNPNYAFIVGEQYYWPHFVEGKRTWIPVVILRQTSDTMFRVEWWWNGQRRESTVYSGKLYDEIP